MKDARLGIGDWITITVFLAWIGSMIAGWEIFAYMGAYFLIIVAMLNNSRGSD